MRKYPELPNDVNIPQGLRGYFDELHKFLQDVFTKLNYQELKNINFTTSAAAPTGGKDGDFHIRVNGANTKIYLNINGSWSAYNNP